MTQLQTTAERWAQLEPHIQVFSPGHDDRAAAVILFHGCGGVRDHILSYARAAADAGVRAFVIDSYAARGMSRVWALAFVCTGVMFRGAERAGDVLAAVEGISQRPDVDPERISLAGWSHGSWSIMDLMTMRLDRPGHAGLADPSPDALAGVKSLFLAYPYGGVGALTRTRDWARAPRTLGIYCEKDHITSLADAEKLFARAAAAGGPFELWKVAGTHAFDETTGVPPMRYDKALAAEAEARFRSLLTDTLLDGSGGSDPRSA